MHTRRWWAALIGTALVGVLTACRSRNAPVATPLEGTKWALDEIGGQPSGHGAGGKPVTLLLSAADRRASGFSGCNHFTGSYQAAGDTLTFGAVAMTMMACADGMELEQAFGAALAETRSYRISGRELDLLADTAVVARFKAR